jgi:hypothetical protein
MTLTMKMNIIIMAMIAVSVATVNDMNMLVNC